VSANYYLSMPTSAPLPKLHPELRILLYMCPHATTSESSCYYVSSYYHIGEHADVIAPAKAVPRAGRRDTVDKNCRRNHLLHPRRLQPSWRRFTSRPHLPSGSYSTSSSTSSSSCFRRGPFSPSLRSAGDASQLRYITTSIQL
jgi:hypothetical protein